MRVHEGVLVVQKGDTPSAFADRVMAQCTLDFSSETATFTYTANNSTSSVQLRHDCSPELRVPPHTSIYLPTHTPVIFLYTETNTESSPLMLSGNKHDVEVWYLKLVECCRSTRTMNDNDDNNDSNKDDTNGKDDKDEEDDNDNDNDDDDDDTADEDDVTTNELRRSIAHVKLAYAGSLYKIGGVRRNWKKRWFELTEMGFIYQEKQHGKILGTIGILAPGTTVQWNSELVKKEMRYYLFVAVPGRTYQMYTTDFDESENWKRALEGAGCAVSEKVTRNRSDSASSAFATLTRKNSKNRQRRFSKESNNSNSGSFSNDTEFSAFFPKIEIDGDNEELARVRSGSLNDIPILAEETNNHNDNNGNNTAASSPTTATKTDRLGVQTEDGRRRANSTGGRRITRPRSWYRLGSATDLGKLDYKSETMPLVSSSTTSASISNTDPTNPTISSPQVAQTVPKGFRLSSPQPTRKAKRKIKIMRPDDVRGPCDFKSFEEFHQFLCPHACNERR